MTIEDFRGSLSSPSPPTLTPLLEALWWEARGDWARAHTIAQDVDTAQGALVHAYLHRREGDPGNARYWYRRAAAAAAIDSLDDEWARLVRTLLQAEV